MKKRFRSLPARITAAVLTAGLIVSSSNLDYVRFILPGVGNVSQVNAEAYLTENDIHDKDLLKAMEVIVNYKKELTGTDMKAFKGDFTSDTYKKYQKPITLEQARGYSDYVNLSECKNIDDLSGLSLFSNITGIDISSFNGNSIPASTFENCTLLEKVIMSDKISIIGAAAFQKCTYLNSIEVKGDEENNKANTLNLTKVNRIEANAFNSTQRFTHVSFDMDNEDLYLGPAAFSQCTFLLEVDIPTLSSGNLGTSCFSGCQFLVDARLNDGLTSIPDNFFRDCDLSKMDKFPSKLINIGKHAFANTCILTPDLSDCNDLKTIDQGAFQVCDFTNADSRQLKLPESLEGDGIKRIAFTCSTVEKINIPKKITTISESTFEGCTKLTDVIIPKDSELTSIDNWAFRRCDSLKSTGFISDLSNLKSIGDYAFCECYSIKYVPDLDEEGNVKKDESGNELEIPEKDEYEVYTIKSGIEDITLPDSLTTIGDYCFANNYATKTINIKNNVKTISKYAFAIGAETAHTKSEISMLKHVNNYELNDLEHLSYMLPERTVTLSKNLTDIEEGAFKCNTHLYTVTYNDVETVKNGKLVLPSTVINIGDNAFSDCARWSEIDKDGEKDYKVYGLTDIDIRNLNLASIGKGVFENNYFLNEAILPASLKVIPERLFNGCGKYSKISENNGEKDIYVIKESHGLKSIVLPGDVEKISKAAFQNCFELEYKGRAFKDSENIDELTLQEQDRVKDEKITLYKFPNTLEEIEDNAFDGCSKLGKVAFGTGLKSIGDYAFANTSLDLLNPPDDKTKAFETGYGLTNVSFSLAEDLDTLGKSAFEKSAITTASMIYNNKLKAIPDSLFSNCYNLKISEMPWSVEIVGSKVYEYDNNLREVQLPTIATVSADIFSEMKYSVVRNATVLKITLNTRPSDRLVRVPIGQSIPLIFIKSTHNNEYLNKQSQDGTDLSEEEEFVSVEPGEDGVTLFGKRETGEKSILKLTNIMTFTNVLDDDGEHYTPKRDVSESFDLTVTDVYAESINITGTGEGANLDDSEKVISISSDKITGDDETNNVEVNASLYPNIRSKNVAWDTSDKNVITVEPVDVDKELTSTIANAKIHVKGGGTAKLTVSNGLSGEKEVKDEVTVKVIYPVDVNNTTINIESLDSDAESFQLEEGATDTITVEPGYSDEGVKADADSKAKVYFESSDTSVVTVDREKGTITAIKSSDAPVTISVYDETGTHIKDISLSVVKEGELTPNIIKISKDRVDVYKDQNSEKITAKVYPDKDNLQGVTWSIENEDFATVTNNADGSATVIGKALGETNLIAKSKVKEDVVAKIPVNVSVPVTTLKFQKPSAQVAVDATLEIGMVTEPSEELALLYQPAEAGNNAVTWKIDNESIAKFVDLTDKVTLSNGIPAIKGIKQGSAKLTATTANGVTVSLDINVYQPLTDFSVEESKTIHKEDTFKLNVVKTPADSLEQITYSSSDENIVTVDSQGNVKAVGEGQATISATRVNNGESKSCTVTVVGKVDSITILDAPIEINVEGTYSIGKASDGEDVKTGYRLSPNSSDIPTWTSSNPQVASVQSENGNVTIKGVAPGTATITATMLSGATASITVNVVSVNTELKFTEESKSVAVGTQTAVTLTKNPAEATEGITYSSSDETIAKVDENGVVTGVAKGNATITATGKVSGVSTSITINVTVPATGVKLVTTYASEKKIYLVKGSSYQLQYKLLPEDSTDTVKYSTNKKKIASVSEDGTITAKKKGNATITVVTESGKKTTLKVYVVKKEKNAKKIKIKTSSIKVGQTVKLKYTVTAATTTNTLSYSVNKPNIAEIDEYGYITGLKKGKVKVTVTASNGKKKTKTIKVK